MFQVTDHAIDEIRKFIDEELQDGEVVRVQRCTLCGGPSFELAVDNPLPNDIKIKFDGAELSVNPFLLDLLNETTLDYMDSGYFYFQ